MNSFLNHISQCINQDAIKTNDSKNYLEESKTNTKIQIKNGGQFVHCNFENVKGNKFPFFNPNQSGLCSISDGVIFTEYNGKLWVIIYELKAGNGSTGSQLKATKLFTDYLLHSVNRVFNTRYKVEIRLISHSKRNRPLLKPSVKYKKKPYSIGGGSIQLPNFLI